MRESVTDGSCAEGAPFSLIHGLVNSKDLVSALCKIICILPTNCFNCVEAAVWSKRDAVPLWISPLGARQISAPRPRSDSELLFDRVANVRHASLVWLHRSARVAYEPFSMVYGFSVLEDLFPNPTGGWGRLIRPTPPVGGSKGGRSSPLTKKWCSSMLHSHRVPL